MKTSYLVGLSLFLALAVVACRPAPTGPSEEAGGQTAAPATTGQTWNATLSGGDEVPPVDTTASGTANFTLSQNGDQIEYTVNVQGLTNVTEAHLHMGKPGANGEVVVWLYPMGPPPSTIQGPLNGVLAQGSFDASRLTGPLEGKTIQDLVNAINSGDIYVNVHTEAHPEGEIRGQVQSGGGAEPMGAVPMATPEASPTM